MFNEEKLDGMEEIIGRYRVKGMFRKTPTWFHSSGHRFLENSGHLS